MQVRLLGPVDVLVDGAARPVLGVRRTAVLALLALHPGEVVSTGRLVGAVWGETPPPAAVNAVQSHVSHLRQILGSKTVIRSRPPGYLLDLGTEGTDVELAERLVGDGTGPADQAHRRSQLRAALALWRGRPLADLADLPGLAWVEEHVERLRRLWLQATRALVETRLALGEHTALVPQLHRLVHDHPLDEQLHGQLIIALYRAGRQADALAAYQRLRRTLHDELGIDPSHPLRDLVTAVLRQDPALDPPPPTGTLLLGRPPAPPAPPPAPPAQLPAAVPAFTGRGRELAALDAVLDSAVDAGPDPATPAEVVVAVVSGTAGVGKTALAVQWAHRVAARFPDGQLYVNLRGSDPDQPVASADALAGFLAGLGVAGRDVPLDPAQRAARYRSEIAGRRMLVVLDNAGSVEQIRPLLPGTPTAMVLVTSRDSLAGLVALHGARRLELGQLPAIDALALLRQLVGARVDAEPAAAAELAGQCARLPLALRVAAELATARPGAPLAELAGELADQQRRLDLLDGGGDPRAGVRAVFSWSVRHLPPDAAGMFRLLGLHPGRDFDPHAAAALADCGLEAARRTLDRLARAHLVHPAGTGRYGMHDLLHAYACDLAATEDSAAERRLALGRLLHYYIATATAAMDRLHPLERHRWPRIPPPGTPTPDLASPDTARAWLDGEQPTLVAVAAHAAAHGLSGYALRLSTILFRYLDGGYHTDGQTVHTGLTPCTPRPASHPRRGQAGVADRTARSAQGRDGR